MDQPYFVRQLKVEKKNQKPIKPGPTIQPYMNYNLEL